MDKRFGSAWDVFASATHKEASAGGAEALAIRRARIAGAVGEVNHLVRQLEVADQMLHRDDQDALGYAAVTARFDQAEAALTDLERLLETLRGA